MRFFTVTLIFLTTLTTLATNHYYYGKEFYLAKNNSTLNKHMVNQILNSGHIQYEQKPDELVESCDQKEDCLEHKTLSYKEARKIIFGKIHLKKDKQNNYELTSSYCQRNFNNKDFPGLNIGPNKIPNSRVLNTEHTWPQSKFNKRFSKSMQKADMHGLYPVESQVNSLRSNLPFANLDHINKSPCKNAARGLVDGANGSYFEPAEMHKGNVARAVFYFSTHYDLAIDPVQEYFLRQWHLEDPVDADEVERNEIIYKYQFTRNPFIDHPETISMISDF